MGITLSHGTQIPNVEITKGMRLAAARKHAGLTQQRMGELLGCSRRTVLRYETAEDAASPAVVMAYSVTTDVNLAWLETGVADFESTDDHFELHAGNNETPAEAGVSGLSQHSVRPKGLEPLTFWLGDTTGLDESGFVLNDADLATEVAFWSIVASQPSEHEICAHEEEA